MAMLLMCRNRLGVQIVSNYISLEQETQARNIAAWTPVVVEVLQGFSAFQDDTVSLLDGALSTLTFV
jgi:hypothetical protein